MIGAVSDLDTITWTGNQYTKQIKKGDKAHIWSSGPGVGIIAGVSILCDPIVTQRKIRGDIGYMLQVSVPDYGKIL